ncbi:hypothetical protein ACHAXA_011873 [Cyclostephanos tholiformis]|uniref:mRNA capping enzyme adenylation domain-containing protein n=1 Tax=Cyclostephanos tholiformis TaxID=382380 RepID=A0ABD3RGL2_9STRA
MDDVYPTSLVAVDRGGRRRYSHPVLLNMAFYIRSHGCFALRMDVTEVTTKEFNQSNSISGGSHPPRAGYEIEMELSSTMTRKFLDPRIDDDNGRRLAEMLSQQLWFMIQQLNPTHDVLEVSEFLREHTSAESTRLAIGQCSAMRQFADSGWRSWRTAVVADPGDANAGVGDAVQRLEGNGYFLSEKTDGVRYLMVFTGTSVVLVDRASHETKRAYQPKPKNVGNGDDINDPMRLAASLVKAGAVLDGEVVVHRRLRRPVFVVFNVLANSSNEPILHLPFEQRLRHLRSASFHQYRRRRWGGWGINLFDPVAVSDPNVALPLVRKNFVDRVDLNRLLSHVSEERGTRIYRYGDTRHQLTDILFYSEYAVRLRDGCQPPEVEYLDTVTIDVEILPPHPNFGRNSHLAATNDDVLRVDIMGEEGTTANRHESGSKIAEVGFDPTTGEWYYRTMRPDKVAPNHISTVLGTLLELAESLSTEELRYRMSVPTGTRDTYTKDVRNMQKHLLDHQRRKNKASGSK